MAPGAGGTGERGIMLCRNRRPPCAPLSQQVSLAVSLSHALRAPPELSDLQLGPTLNTSGRCWFSPLITRGCVNFIT